MSRHPLTGPCPKSQGRTGAARARSQQDSRVFGFWTGAGRTQTESRNSDDKYVPLIGVLGDNRNQGESHRRDRRPSAQRTSMAWRPEVNFAIGYLPVLSIAPCLPVPCSAVAMGTVVSSTPREGHLPTPACPPCAECTRTGLRTHFAPDQQKPVVSPSQGSGPRDCPGGCSAPSHVPFHDARCPFRHTQTFNTDLRGIYELREGALSLTGLSQTAMPTPSPRGRSLGGLVTGTSHLLNVQVCGGGTRVLGRGLPRCPPRQKRLGGAGWLERPWALGVARDAHVESREAVVPSGHGWAGLRGGRPLPARATRRRAAGPSPQAVAVVRACSPGSSVWPRDQQAGHFLSPSRPLPCSVSLLFVGCRWLFHNWRLRI